MEIKTVDELWILNEQLEDSMNEDNEDIIVKKKKEKWVSLESLKKYLELMKNFKCPNKKYEEGFKDLILCIENELKEASP